MEPEVEPQPINIAEVKLYCSICKAEVPEKRARGRSRATCKPDCHTILRKVINHQLRSRKCPACYHPSTPEERMEFMQWRKQRGDRREKRGRPAGKKKSIDSSDSEKSTLPPSGQTA